MFSEYTDTIKRECRFGYNLRESEGVQNRLFARIGGWNDDIDKMHGNDSRLVYDVPIQLSSKVEEGDKIATLLIDKFEDTGDSHKTRLYEVHAYDSARKVTEKDINDDRDGEKTESYYERNHGLDVKVHY